MKKILLILCSLMMTLTLCACSKSNNPGKVADPMSLDYYFFQYDMLNYEETNNGIVMIFDDGSKYGLAVSVTLTKEQKEDIALFDASSDTYSYEIEEIAMESDEYTVTELDACVPDMSIYDNLTGQKLAVLFDDGYANLSNMDSDNSNTIELSNGTYNINVIVEEIIYSSEDMDEEYERTLTIQSIEFTGWGKDFFNSLG